MRKFLFGTFAALSVTTMAQNPFFQEFDTPYNTPPFSQIAASHYEEAVDRGIALGLQEVEAICNQRSMPDFENTIVALENSGSDLTRVLNVFYNLLEADSDEEMMAISLRIAPKLSDYSTSISLNERLWNRVKRVYETKENFNLTPEESRLLQNTYDSFARNGANLEGDDRAEYRRLQGELSQLTTRFGQNVLKELNTYKIFLSKEDLAGLPENLVAQAAEDAKAEGREGEYLFTLAQPTYMAFLKNSDRRDLREKFYRLYTGRNIAGEFSNMEIMKQISDTRRKIANLLGYETYAQYSLVKTMAGSPENVYDLLNRLRDAYKPALKAELDELTAFASALNGSAIEIMPWDYSYYSNKLRNERYSYDEEELRPYFELGNVINGVFGLADKLYGLKFEKNDKVDVYHQDVTAYDVKDSEGNFIGVLYTDFFPRASKRPGAWMTNFREQYIDEPGVNHRPLVSIVMNFTKPTADKPAMLTPYEVETFLHEFGHALHGLLASTRFKSMSGTSVYRDFVELPSQFNENYLTEREFLDSFARHYQTGEPIPAELVDRMIAGNRFGAAYSCIRQLNFGYVDMAWHDRKEAVEDPVALENGALEQVQIFAPVEGSMISTQFSHIFSGGYAAGYYSYKWSEVLDADAFAKFKENGIFDKATADSFKENILMRGGTEDPAELYRRFRGADPSIDALLERDGIKVSDKKPCCDNCCCNKI